jgi:hypothetical protein
MARCSVAFTCLCACPHGSAFFACALKEKGAVEGKEYIGVVAMG